MALVRPMIRDGGLPAREVLPGDLVASGDNVNGGAITTVGAGTLTGAAIANGLIFRSGPAAAFTDTTSSALNILTALAGNTPAADIVPGTSFRVRYINGVAFAMTFAAGTGVVAGSGTLNVAASLWRDYIFTVLNATPLLSITGTLVSASATVVFALPAGMSAIPIGPAPGSFNATPGATVTGTGVAAATTVAGMTQGQGGVTGMVMSGTATASGTVPLTFGPTIQIDSIGSGTA